MREHPHRRTPDGRGYACARCGVEIPDGCQILPRYSGKDALTGVRVTDFDGNVRHECGAAPTDGLT